LSEQVTVDHEKSRFASINGGARQRYDRRVHLPATTMALTLDGGTGNDVSSADAARTNLIAATE